MARAVILLPDAQLAHLRRAYDRTQMASRVRAAIGVAVFAACLGLAWIVAEIDLAKLFGNISRFTNYLGRLFVLEGGRSVFTDIYGTTDSWYWGLWKWSKQIGETLVIAYLGTVLGMIGAFLLCFAASANIAPNRTSLFAARRFLEFCRTVPEIVFALIFVLAFGLGPLPGVLALAIHSMGALGKLFSEVVENIDMKPVDGLSSTGATWVETVRYAVVPQVLSNFASYGLLRFEINVRGAAIMGLVGAGGIGQDLVEAIRKFYYSDVSAILLMIIVTVFAIDILTDLLRQRLLGKERG